MEVGFKTGILANAPMESSRPCDIPAASAFSFAASLLLELLCFAEAEAEAAGGPEEGTSLIL